MRNNSRIRRIKLYMLSEDPFPFLFWKVKFDETIKDISIFNDLKASQGDDITKKKSAKP